MEILNDGLTIVVLAAIVQGLSESIIETLPFMNHLGQWELLAKKVVVFIVGLGIVFGFSIDLSETILQTPPVTMAVGQVFTAIMVTFGASLLHAGGKLLKR